MKKVYILFISFTIIFNLSLAVFNIKSVHATTIGIDTSTSASATTNQAQRKTFYDSVNYKNWVFYHNGSAIESPCSTSVILLV